MGFCLILPYFETAEAATRTTATKKSPTARVSQSSAKRVSTLKSSTKRVRRYSPTRATARRARLARAKAAAYARDMRVLQTPQYRTDANGMQVPDIRAEAAIIYNPVTHEVLWEENSQSSRSIASITKVMTAVVFLEHASNLGYEIEVQPADVRAASTTYLRAYERATPDTLLHLLLIGSDNAAARVLARSSPFGSQGFIDRMNEKAKELGLEATHYADPSGLDAANVSSAYDMARLIAFAGNDERIASIMRKGEQSVTTSRRTITIHSTNKLVREGSDVREQVKGGKTGFIRQAGYCLATLLQLPQGDPVAVVVLGARSNAGRFMETKHLFNWLADRTKTLLTNDPSKAATTAAPAIAAVPQPQQ
jgi:D-alanyl-D-alanine endopeptidase (penicillin-binding protein 7)